MAHATMIGALKCPFLIIPFTPRAGSSHAVSAVLNFFKALLTYGAHSCGSVHRYFFLIALSHSTASRTLKSLS